MKNDQMPMPDHLYDKLVKAFDVVIPRMHDGDSYKIKERDGLTYWASKTTMLDWKRNAEERADWIVWDEVMHILNVLNKELP